MHSWFYRPGTGENKTNDLFWRCSTRRKRHKFMLSVRVEKARLSENGKDFGVNYDDQEFDELMRNEKTWPKILSCGILNPKQSRKRNIWNSLQNVTGWFVSSKDALDRLLSLFFYLHFSSYNYPLSPFPFSLLGSTCLIGTCKRSLS